MRVVIHTPSNHPIVTRRKSFRRGVVVGLGFKVRRESGVDPGFGERCAGEPGFAPSVYKAACDGFPHRFWNGFVNVNPVPSFGLLAERVLFKRFYRIEFNERDTTGDVTDSKGVDGARVVAGGAEETGRGNVFEEFAFIDSVFFGGKDGGGFVPVGGDDEAFSWMVRDSKSSTGISFSVPGAKTESEGDVFSGTHFALSEAVTCSGITPVKRGGVMELFLFLVGFIEGESGGTAEFCFAFSESELATGKKNFGGRCRGHERL
jgi:hypothetical protein